MQIIKTSKAQKKIKSGLDLKTSQKQKPTKGVQDGHNISGEHLLRIPRPPKEKNL